MHGHLVAVEVGVEGSAHERMDLDRLAFHQQRLESLDAQPVQRGRPVQQHRVLLDDVLEHVPDVGATPFDHPLGRFDVLRDLRVDQPLHDKRLEQLERHQFGQPALVQAQRGPRDDDRAARVVHALAEQVLAEATLLALEHVRQRLQRPIAGACHRAAPSAVVEQRIDRFLQHALLVVDNDLGCAQVEQTLQPVVAVDDTSVEIIQVRGREAPAVELHHRAQIGRDARHGVENHRPRVVDAAPVLVSPVERAQDLEALDGLLLALGRQWPAPVGRLDGGTQLGLFDVEVHVGHELRDGLGAHAALEVLAVAILQLAPEILVVDDHPLVQIAQRREGALHEVFLLVGLFVNGIEVTLGFALGRPQLAFLGVLGLELLQLVLELGEPLRPALRELLVDDVELFGLLGLEPRQVSVQLLAVDLGDQVRGEVDDTFQRFGLELLAGVEASQKVRQP